MTEIDLRRAHISAIIAEIQAHSLALMSRGVDPGNGPDRTEAQAIIRRIEESYWRAA